MNAVIEFCTSCWVFLWIAAVVFVLANWKDVAHD